MYAIHVIFQFTVLCLSCFGLLSILFADIRGFTKLSEEMSALNLVQLLNNLFASFDEIASVSSIEISVNPEITMDPKMAVDANLL